jgi:hypothetical protein
MQGNALFLSFLLDQEILPFRLAYFGFFKSNAIADPV